MKCKIWLIVIVALIYAALKLYANYTDNKCDATLPENFLAAMQILAAKQSLVDLTPL
jgi:hypothetical protein